MGVPPNNLEFVGGSLGLAHQALGSQIWLGPLGLTHPALATRSGCCRQIWLTAAVGGTGQGAEWGRGQQNPVGGEMRKKKRKGGRGGIWAVGFWSNNPCCYALAVMRCKMRQRIAAYSYIYIYIILYRREWILEQEAQKVSYTTVRLGPSNYIYLIKNKNYISSHQWCRYPATKWGHAGCTPAKSTQPRPHPAARSYPVNWLSHFFLCFNCRTRARPGHPLARSGHGWHQIWKEW